MLGDALSDSARLIQGYLSKGWDYPKETKERAWAIIRLMDELRLTYEMDWNDSDTPVSKEWVDQIQERRRAEVEQQNIPLPEADRAFIEPFFTQENITSAEALGAIKEMLARKSAEGKPPEQAATEIINEHYQGMAEGYWPYLQDVKQQYVALLSGRERLPSWAGKE